MLHNLIFIGLVIFAAAVAPYLSRLEDGKLDEANKLHEVNDPRWQFAILCSMLYGLALFGPIAFGIFYLLFMS